MKQYPKIPHYDKSFLKKDFVAFDKLDGSNLRFEFSKNKKWYKFGTRKTMFDKSNPTFGPAIDIFIEKYGEDLEKVFTEKYPKIPSFVVFCEWFGENSFAGQHIEGDKMDLVLFEVYPYKKVLSPWNFIDNFGHLDIPKIIREGKMTEDFYYEIKSNTDLKEGVICKGDDFKFKIKTDLWLEKLKEKFGQSVIEEEFSF